MITKIECTFKNKNYLVGLNNYSNGRIAISLIDKIDYSPFMVCTSNLPEYYIEIDEVIIKNYSENKGILDALEYSGIVKYTGKIVTSGYEALEVCTITNQKILEYQESTQLK